MTPALPRSARRAPLAFSPETLSGDIQPGRYVYAAPTPFTRPVKTWVPRCASLSEILSELFPDAALRRTVTVRFDGRLIDAGFHAPPPLDVYVELSVTAHKGVLRAAIQIIAIVAVFFITFWLTGNVQLAGQLALSIGNVVGSLLARALVPPSAPNNDKIDTPKVYTIEGARNQVRPGQPVPVILGTRRVFPDVIVPFYQEIVGEDIYTIGALCWACHDISISNLRVGETLLTSGDGVQVQHSLLQTSPVPTLIPGLAVPSGNINIDLDDTEWRTRTTPTDAEQVEIQLYFPQGIGSLSSKGKKESHSVTIEVRYKETGSSTYQSSAAADVVQSDDIAAALGAENRRDLYALLGFGFHDQYNAALTTQGGNVNLTRTFTRSDPGKPFPASIKFAVPPGAQYDVEVRRAAAPSEDAGISDAVTFLAMNTFQAGNPFPTRELAVTAFRIKAGENYSGVLDTINGIASSLSPVYVPADIEEPDDNAEPENFTGLIASSNPADLILQSSRGPHTQSPTPDEEIDWPSFGRFWTWCDLNRYNFDYAETGVRGRGEMQQLIASAAQGRVLRIGGRLSVVIDGPNLRGNRTMLTPDNARQFSFSKSFPPDVHALRVEFVNRALDYRQDEFFVFAPGYSKDNAVKFERFTLPGKVIYDDIYGAAETFLKTAMLQTLSGQCEQDIEGRFILRFGDRVGIRHSTLQVTGDSGRVTGVTTDENGDVTGFDLTEAPELFAGETYVARWIKIGTDILGGAYISADEVNHLAALRVDFGQASTSRSHSYQFAAPVTASHAPEPGCILVVGVLTDDALDAVVTDLERLDDDAKSVIIKWVEYAPERFEGLVIPPHTPLTPLSLTVRPLAPVITQTIATDDVLTVGFTIEAIPGAQITGFDVAYRETPAPGADGVWLERPTAPSLARAVHLPAGRSGQTFDVKIVTRAGHLRSDPVISADISASAVVAAPQGPVVAAASRDVASGASIPVIAVSVEPVDDPALFETLIIEMKRSADTDWYVATTAPADNPVKDITSIVPGETYDVRLGWRNMRGAVTPLDARPVVTGLTPGNLIVNDTRQVNGVDGTLVTTKLQNIDASGQATIGLLGAALVVGATSSFVSGTVTPAITSITLTAQVLQTPYGQVTYDSGSVTGLTADTVYHLYVDDAALGGGAKTYFATETLSDITASAARIYLGACRTQDSGGGGGSYQGAIRDGNYVEP